MKISYTNLNTLTRWEAFQFLADVLKFTESYDEGMPELFTNQLAKLDAAFKLYDKALVQEQQSSPEHLAKAEETRDYAVRKIYSICREYADYRFDKDKEDAANTILSIFKPYGTGHAIATMAQDTETAVITNLLQDFQTEKSDASLIALGLMDAVDQLTSNNTLFERKQQERSQNQAQFVVGVVKTARNDAQAEFMMFVDVVNALSIVEGEEKYTALKQYITSRLSEYVVRAKRRTKKKEEETPEEVIL